MTQLLVFGVMAGYFCLLLIIGYFPTQKSDNTTFFTANGSSSLFLVAVGMVGDTLTVSPLFRFTITIMLMPIATKWFEAYLSKQGFLFLPKGVVLSKK